MIEEKPGEIIVHIEVDISGFKRAAKRVMRYMPRVERRWRRFVSGHEPHPWKQNARRYVR